MVCLFFFVVALTSCATYQPLKPRVMLHPKAYQNFITTVEGLSIAAILFNPNRSMYSDPNDPNPSKPTFNLLEAGVCPIRLIFFNESAEPIVIDPTQITCTDVSGVTYQPFGVEEAGDAIVASQAFKTWVKGAMAGALLGGMIGAGLGAATGAAIGGRDWARRGAVIGGTSGAASGAGAGGSTLQFQMERQIRQMLARDQLKETTLPPNMRHEGMILFPAVNFQTVEIVLSDPEYQQTRQIEIPILIPSQ